MAGETRSLPWGRSADRWAVVVALDSLAGSILRHRLPAAALAIGGILLSRVHATWDPVAFALLLLGGGALLTWLIAGRTGPAVRAYTLAFCACVLVAGLSQAWSLRVFGVPMSTSDTDAFYGAILREPPFFRIGERFPVNAPYAVIVWQQVYVAAQALGFSFGPWIGVLFNSLLVGLTSAIVVLATGELVGSDPARLRRAGTLAAGCGMFWLFGALFLRDAFTLLINTVVLWMLLRAVRRPSPVRLLTSAGVITAGAWTMLGLRPASAALFAAFALLAAVTWLWFSRPGLGRLLAAAVLLVALVLSYPRLQQGVEQVIGSVAAVSETYERVGTGAATDASLGMTLIVGQPLPVRLILGSLFVLISPIPLWAGLGPQAVDYLFIKAAHGVYMLVILPLVLLGAWGCLRALRAAAAPATAVAGVFLVLYALTTLGAVAATSLETRHFGQFLPALLILAALPDLSSAGERERWLRLRAAWIAAAVLVHLGWVVLKFVW